MKITIAQGAFLPVPPLRGGAVEKIWFALGQEFARRGHEVTHLSRAFKDLPHEEVIEKVRHLRVPGYDAPRSMVLLKLCDLLYSVRVLRKLPVADVLITNTFWLPILLRSSRFGKVYVHVARYPKGQMRLYAHAARLQTVSHPIKRAILAEVPGCKALVECIPNPLPEWNSTRSQVPPTDRLKRLLYVGRIHPEKGLDLLIAAIARIPKELFAGWKLLVVGPAEASAGGGGVDYLAALRRTAESIADRVEWIGPVYDAARLAGYYRNASLFLYPSLAERGESFGLALLEAMSHGCPALVSDLSCFRDFIDADRNGFVFDHRAPEPVATLAEAITELIRDEAQIESVRGPALSKAGEFSVERVAGLYLQDFQTLSTS